MITFMQFLEEAARNGEAVNIVFEERLFELIHLLHRIADALSAEELPYEVIGGLAVLIHVEEVDPAQSSLTRDVDLMIRRSDLERIKQVAADVGLRFRHAAGVDMLLDESSRTSRFSVHLIFSEEKVRPQYLTATPPIAPQPKRILGQEVMVIPVADLLTMKLTSFRLKDQVHVKTLDAVGLITPEIERALLPELSARLQHVRETE